jgi:hypothetical protein
VRKKLTGWLILLIVLLGPLSFGGGSRNLSTLPNLYKETFPDASNLQIAIVLFQLLVGAGIVVWAYTAWLLYRGEPGTLRPAQVGLVVGAFLRLLGGYSVPLLGGLPPDIAERMIRHSFVPTVITLGIVGAWYLYLIRSERVRDIYSD